MTLLPWLVVAAIGSLLVGAAAGEVLARRLAPSMRQVVAFSLYGVLAVMVLSGADLQTFARAASQAQANAGHAIAWVFARQIAVMGLIIGTSLFLIQRARLPQLLGLAGSGLIGLPILTNLWIGAGMTYAFSA